MPGVGKQRRLEVVTRRVQGATTRQIADAMGVTIAAIQQTLSIPEVRQQVEELQADLGTAARNAMHDLVGEAVGVVADLMRDEKAPPYVRLQAAQTLLDRTGHGKSATVSVEHSGQVEHRHSAGPIPDDVLKRLPDDQLADLKASLLRAVEDEERERAPLLLERNEEGAQTQRDVIDAPSEDPPAGDDDVPW